MTRFSKFAGVAMVSALFSLSAQAADISAGKAKADQACAACHAKEGNWSAPIDPSYPKLAGQHKDYLYQALLQYKDGRRKNGIMAGMAAALSKDEMNNLSAYFASLPGELNTHR
jgi:cytochrome c553